MAQVVLLSERAGELTQLGESRLNALRLQKRPYASSYLATQYGYIIAQVAGRTERVIIDNRPPYLIIDLLYDNEGTGDLRFHATFGGVSGEPFLPIKRKIKGLPVEVGQASTQYQCMGQYAYSTVSVDVDATDGGYGLYRVVAITVYDVETNNYRLVFAHQSYIAVNGDALNAFAPLGRAEDGGEYMACSFHKKINDDDDESFVGITIVKHNTDDDTPPDFPIWPILGENDGYYSDMAPVTLMVNAGRMRLAWFQQYADTLNDDGDIIHRGADPKIVVYNAADGTYTSTTFRSLTPELEEAFSEDETAYRRISGERGLVYCGGGVLIVCFMYRQLAAAKKMYVFRSTDHGSSWTKVDLPLEDEEAIDAAAHNSQSIRSLAPGKVILTTSRSGSVRLYYSENAGASWVDHGEVDVSQESVQLGAYIQRMQAVWNKLGRKFVYTATKHDLAAGKVYELVFDSFHPNAKLIGDPVLIHGNTKYDKTKVVQILNRAAYAEKGAPLLQGYLNELEGET